MLFVIILIVVGGGRCALLYTRGEGCWLFTVFCFLVELARYRYNARSYFPFCSCTLYDTYLVSKRQRRASQDASDCRPRTTFHVLLSFSPTPMHMTKLVLQTFQPRYGPSITAISWCHIIWMSPYICGEIRGKLDF